MLNRPLQTVRTLVKKGRIKGLTAFEHGMTQSFDTDKDVADIRDLSYSHAVDPGWRRAVVRSIEMARGQDRLIPNYLIWRRYLRRFGTAHMMAAAFRLLKMRVEVDGQIDESLIHSSKPTVLIANHPFGILDGLAVLRIAEELGRPYKIIINKELLRVPEFRARSLPIDFNKTREATKTNLATKKEAISRIKEGEVIVIFPSGGVATSDTPFGLVNELPWHNFTARLIREGEANVLPVYFHGQNSRLFQLASHTSVTLRYAMLVGEFTDRRRHIPLKISIGDAISYEEIATITDKVELTTWLHRRVMAMKNSRQTTRVYTSNGPRIKRKYQMRIRRKGLKSLKLS